MITMIYSLLHMFVDGICAFAMFGRFVSVNHGYEYYLIYNFCAFALQMPFGAVLDSLAIKREKNDSKTCALLGVILTIVGAWIHPVILGIGNALFHVGAGVSVIREDNVRRWKGQALGIFVAPGALGLFLGTQLAKQSLRVGWFFVCIVIVLVVATIGYRMEPKCCVPVKNERKGGNLLFVVCFLVVILRSYVGMAVTFSWKNTLLASTLGVLAVVLGKMAGGMLAARIGTKVTVVGSLLLATVCYLFSSQMIVGLLALFLFNMTMPITLYLLVKRWKSLPGFSFGLLTFGLFLGFLPVYFGVQVPIPGNVIGAVGSILSLVLLLAGKGWWSE